MFPDNIIQACTQQVSTVYRKKSILVHLANETNITNSSVMHTTVQLVKELKYTDGTNVMGKFFLNEKSF